jgi:hypothetical protein
MEEFVCVSSVVPLRSGPSHNSEMISQILLGERFSIVDKAGDWTKIRMFFDDSYGWVDNEHFIFQEHSVLGKSTILTLGIRAYREDGSGITIYCGSEVYEISADNKNFRVGNDLYRVENPVPFIPPENNLASTAAIYLNAPYLWGGRTGHGIDCSGLTQLVYKMHGKSIPRNSYEQVEKGETINLLSDAIAGDLLFFDNDSGHITHVAMMYDPEHVIHASGSVRIDPIDHQGIYKVEIKGYSHKLRLIKRYLKE